MGGGATAIHSATIALLATISAAPFLVRLSRGARTVIYQNLGIGGLFIHRRVTLSDSGC